MSWEKGSMGWPCQSHLSLLYNDNGRLIGQVKSVEVEREELIEAIIYTNDQPSTATHLGYYQNEVKAQLAVERTFQKLSEIEESKYVEKTTQKLAQQRRVQLKNERKVQLKNVTKEVKEKIIQLLREFPEDLIMTEEVIAMIEKE